MHTKIINQQEINKQKNTGTSQPASRVDHDRRPSRGSAAEQMGCMA